MNESRCLGIDNDLTVAFHFHGNNDFSPPPVVMCVLSVLSQGHAGSRGRINDKKRKLVWRANTFSWFIQQVEGDTSSHCAQILCVVSGLELIYGPPWWTKAYRLAMMTKTRVLRSAYVCWAACHRVYQTSRPHAFNLKKWSSWQPQYIKLLFDLMCLAAFHILMLTGTVTGNDQLVEEGCGLYLPLYHSQRK